MNFRVRSDLRTELSGLAFDVRTKKAGFADKTPQRNPRCRILRSVSLQFVRLSRFRTMPSISPAIARLGFPSSVSHSFGPRL